MENTQQTSDNQPEQFFYFLISGEIEYTEGKHNKTPKYMKTNTVFQSPLAGLTAKQLAKCQVNLQMNFYKHYSRSHSSPPDITNVTIIATSPLGMFSEQEFMADAPTNRPATEKSSGNA